MKSKQILFAIIGIFVLLGAVLVTVPLLIPKDVYRNQIEKAASQALQRRVSFTGEVDISLFPTIAASVGGVTVANPEGFSDPYMVTAGELRSAVRLLPLFSGRVEIRELAFIDAAVSLEKLADGRANWVFGEAAPPPASPEPKRPDSSAGFNGSVGQARLANASLTYRDAVTGDYYDLHGLDLTASMKRMDDPFRLKASGIFQQEAFDLSLTLATADSLMNQAPARVDARLDMDLLSLDFDGALALGTDTSLTGEFRVKAPDLGGLADFLSLEVPVSMAVLGGAEMRGTIDGPVTAPRLTFEKLGVEGGLVRADYEGQFAIGPQVTVDGRLKVSIPDAAEFTAALGGDIPSLPMLERIDLGLAISGPLEQLAFTEIDFQHQGKLLMASYQGAASLEGPGKLEGSLSLASDRLRDLLAAAGTEAADGPALESFSLNGRLAGSFSAAELTEMDMRLDDAAVTGRAGIDLGRPRPLLTASLDMGRLDLSPFLPAQETPPEAPQPLPPWSPDPIDLSGLTAADAVLEIKASELVIGAITLTDAALAASLNAGQLTADLSRFSAFGGLWTGKMTVDAARPVPEYSFAMEGQSVVISNLLGTLAGFDRLTGSGTFQVNATSKGNSVAEMMNQLNGQLSTSLTDGALKGLNISQLMRSAQSLQQALAAGKLNELDLRSVLSPEAETDFTTFSTRLNVRNGVADIELMKLLNPILGIDGSGQINLGGQALDVRLLTAIDKSAKGEGGTLQLGGIPVPIRLSGTWNDVKVSPDLKGVQQAVQAELGGRLQQEITNRVGPAGGLIGNLLGSDSQSGTQDQKGPALERELGDAAERAARDALGGLFGRPADKKPDRKGQR